MRKHQKGGFSLAQIFLILACVAILVFGVIYIVKPSKILEKSRDAQRLSDMKNIAAAVNQYLAAGHNFQGLVGPYSSIDAGFTNDAERKNVTGKGWIPLTLSMETLPLDPLNNTAHYYRFGVSVSAGTYEIDTVFESPVNTPKHATDSGNDPNVYESGTDLTIL